MGDNYEPQMSDERAQRIREWHENAISEHTRQETVSVTCLGRKFEVLVDVFDPKPVGLWESVLDEVKKTDRVLDMGTGSGVNGILASSKSSDVVAVDVNPSSVENAKHNAELNGVASHMDIRVSDLFESVEGKFDLILFDPPFRWFKPRDMRERSTADENYQTLTAFFDQVKGYLTDDGRILLFFGTSGDIDYLKQLIDRTGLKKEVVNHSEHEKDGMQVEYFTFKLTM
jgi:release factor glutamine methyltransferase